MDLEQVRAERAESQIEQLSAVADVQQLSAVAEHSITAVQLKELKKVEASLYPREDNQNLNLRNRALRKIETIWNSGPMDSCWFPYVAMELFDRLPPLISEDVDLVVVSCLTLAYKMEKKKIPIRAIMLERGLAYTLAQVGPMELHLLRSLEWKTRQLTPLCFVQCLAKELPESCNIRFVYQIIVWTQANTLFTSFTPSIIAVSSIMCITILEDQEMMRDRFQVLDLTIDENCTNLMEAQYHTKLNSMRAEASNISQGNSMMNIALEWIDQIPSIEVGLFQRALGCLFPLFECFQAGPSSTQQAGPSSTQQAPSTETSE